MRSLYFGDEDYPECVGDVLFTILSADTVAFARLEDYLRVMKSADFGNVQEAVWDVYAVAPKVFSIPIGHSSDDTCAIMMPFAPEFKAVRAVIRSACDPVGLRPIVADEVWDSPSIVQDVFDIIFRARIVVADFSGLNPNVMYEMGLAHALGRDVVPITQPTGKLPFDVAHYRTIVYENTEEGLSVLRRRLEQAFRGVLKWGGAAADVGPY